MSEKLDKLSKNLEDTIEKAKPLTTEQRKGLKDSQFGVPGKRAFPLDTCARTRSAMSRFNQGKGLTGAEKRTLYRKILRAARKCNIDPSGFVEKYGGRYG